MDLNLLFAFGCAKQAGGKQGSPVPMIVMMVAIFAIFYFLLIRPQQKKQKDLQRQVQAIKKGDKIITAGGIKAKVLDVKEDVLVVQSGETKFEIARMAVQQVVSS